MAQHVQVVVHCQPGPRPAAVCSRPIKFPLVPLRTDRDSAPSPCACPSCPSRYARFIWHGSGGSSRVYRAPYILKPCLPPCRLTGTRIMAFSGFTSLMRSVFNQGMMRQFYPPTATFEPERDISSQAGQVRRASTTCEARLTLRDRSYLLRAATAGSASRRADTSC